MTEENTAKLHGTMVSPYVRRVKLALRIKGIKLEFIEEDLANKSELLLQYNPVYKKVPVLVHNGRPIAESFNILEYIDETWTDPPHLLPRDPYQRAIHRFWAPYFQQVAEMTHKALNMAECEEQRNAINESKEKLDVAEERMNEIFPNGVPIYQIIKPGYLDIVFYSLYGIPEAAEEVVAEEIGTRYPLLVSWLKALSQVEEVKEVMPQKPELLGVLKFIHQE